MSNRALAEIILGCFLGTALGAAMIFGMIELADKMLEWTDALR